MQPYTPHGDSNEAVDFVKGFHCSAQMQPYTPHGDSNIAKVGMRVSLKPSMQPYTPHGDSNFGSTGFRMMIFAMQPYTPHGDSNIHQDPILHGLSRDATLYPSRGQQHDLQDGIDGLFVDATLFLLRLADFCRAPAWCLQKPERCASRAFAASSAGRARRGCPSRGQ